MTTEEYGKFKGSEFLEGSIDLPHVPGDTCWWGSDNPILASEGVTHKQDLTLRVIQCDTTWSMTREMIHCETSDRITVIDDIIHEEWLDLKENSKKFEKDFHNPLRSLTWFLTSDDISIHGMSSDYRTSDTPQLSGITDMIDITMGEKNGFQIGWFFMKGIRDIMKDFLGFPWHTGIDEGQFRTIDKITMGRNAFDPMNSWDYLHEVPPVDSG